MKEQVLLGDEAVALGALHAGMTAAYAYPGTPSTEIVEYLLRYKDKHGGIIATWTANEKTAYEEALGASLAGRRTLVAMKHVGLNVAADPFMNSALLSIGGGLVVAVADDPGMHSSQNEQDSRYFSDFGRVPCFEPANQQEAYDMTREAFDLSERFQLPVMIRLVTRLAHSRAAVRLSDPLEQKPVGKPTDGTGWILLPGNARRQWQKILDQQANLNEQIENLRFNSLTLDGTTGDIGVITTGIAVNYFMENIGDLDTRPPHLHIGAYPFPAGKIRELASRVKKLLVLEEGYPYVERLLRGILPGDVEIEGRMSGRVPEAGELTPDIVRKALGLELTAAMSHGEIPMANRPPQLCTGCPHITTYEALKKALAEYGQSMVTSDIGCYTLGALPPYNAIESCVCMGASVSMAKGAADAGLYPVVGVIGDSTFLHSGITPLLDAVAADADMTLLILDNSAVAMTGGQETLLTSSSLDKLILGLGVDPDHVHTVDAHPKRTDEVYEAIKSELKHHGLSVIVARRECIETAKRKKAKPAAAER